MSHDIELFVLFVNGQPPNTINLFLYYDALKNYINFEKKTSIFNTSEY